MSVDRQAAAVALEAFLRAIGRDPQNEPELRSTGARVTDAFVDELCAGYAVDVDGLVDGNVIEGQTDLVVLRGIALTTTCPHHLMLAKGTATVAFAPDGAIVGLGTLSALVDAFSRRLILQEEIGQNVVSVLARRLKPRWAACRVVLTHGCMVARGERQHGSRVETVALAGELDPATRSQVYVVLGVGASEGT